MLVDASVEVLVNALVDASVNALVAASVEASVDDTLVEAFHHASHAMAKDPFEPPPEAGVTTVFAKGQLAENRRKMPAREAPTDSAEGKRRC